MAQGQCLGDEAASGEPRDVRGPDPQPHQELCRVVGQLLDGELLVRDGGAAGAAVVEGGEPVAASEAVE
jgi:hypothetical protein